MQTTLASPGAVDRERTLGGLRRRSVPILEPAAGGPASRVAAAIGHGRHPAVVFLVTVVGGLALIACLSIGLGTLLVHVLAEAPGLKSANRYPERLLAAHRSSSLTHASLIGSISAGGVVLPIVVAVVGAICAVARRWRLAGFVIFALLVESAAYRATTLVVHEHRPRVPRLESLPANASYPSGHTAASIAVYSGLALLFTSAFASRLFRQVAWTAAVAITAFVALSRMYRGMHYPLDVVGGALIGTLALLVVVFACRAAGAASVARADGRFESRRASQP